MKHLICNNNLENEIAANLSRFKNITLSSENVRRAAVAVTVVDYQGKGALSGLPFTSDDAAALILTRRSARLKSHAGQWALPGGSIDSGESPQQTALRELEEEVGLHLSDDKVLGCLDDFITRSGFRITPVVIWGGNRVNLVANEEEVASIHRIPFCEFLRPDAPILDHAVEGEHPILLMPAGDSCIATPTAAILYQFREVALLGNETRVAHFEQPHFAWQ
jgi:8-oxo-dGTP pyrophosphatase MutT (NUDIX family)